MQGRTVGTPEAAEVPVGVRSPYSVPGLGPFLLQRPDDPTGKDLQLDTSCPSSHHPEALLTQPDVPLKGHKHIAGFQVAVDDPLAVQEVERLQHLAAYNLNLGLGEASV